MNMYVFNQSSIFTYIITDYYYDINGFTGTVFSNRRKLR